MPEADLSSLKRIARSCAAALALALAGAGAAAQEQAAEIDRSPVPALEGRYEGLGSAQGMTVEITDVDDGHRATLGGDILGELDRVGDLRHRLA